MITVSLTSLGHTTKVKDYKLNKKLDDFGVVLSIDSEAKFKNPANSELLEMTSRGLTDEPATFTVNCADETITYDGFIYHNEGKFNLKHCYAEKPLRFKTVYDCIKNLTINIFDYTPLPISTVQGTLERGIYTNESFVNFGNEDNPYTLDQVLSSLGGIPNRTPSGWAVEYIKVLAVPLFTTQQGDIYEYEVYTGHKCTIFVSYVRAFSTTQLSSDWFEIFVNGWVLNPALFPPYFWNVPDFTFVSIQEFSTTIHYVQSEWTAGRYQLYKDVDISNTYSLNEILEDIFSCSGKSLVSNFFNINPDGTEPNNNAYDYAATNLQLIRIVQSFDIIRENALQDSFANSGKIQANKLVIDLNKFFGLQLVYDIAFDVIRWEHYTYFNTKGIDLIANNIDYELSKDMEVNKDIVNKESWFMGAETPSDGFYTSVIDYQNYQLNSDVNDNSIKIENLLTDVFGTFNNAEYEGDQYKKLFYLLATDGTEIVGLNGSLRLRTIIQNLHSQNRPLPVGSHDGVITQFSGFSFGLSTEVKFFKSIKTFNKINPGNTILTENGIFVIDELEFEKETVTAKIRK